MRTGVSARERARSCAAATNSRNSGAGLVGRDLNSGWNWLATNQGWFGSSIRSGRAPGPEMVGPEVSQINAAHVRIRHVHILDDFLGGSRLTQRLYSLMHDHQYRVAIAWQNSGDGADQRQAVPGMPGQNRGLLDAH